LWASVSDFEGALLVLDSQQKVEEDKYNVHMTEQARLQDLLKSVSSRSTGPDFSSQFTGEWILTIPTDKFSKHDEYMKYRVGDTEDCIVSKYLRSMDRSLIGNIDIVHNAAQLRLFHGAIETFEKRLETGLFNAELSFESNPEERQKVLTRLRSSPILAKHNRKALIVGGFHGTTVEKAESILKVGFANLATLDDGWYGKGIYFTSQPQYAYQYCKTKSNPCLIFSYLILANPFPVIWDDAKSTSDLRFKAKPNYRNYGCHFVPVIHYKGADYRPPNPDVPAHSNAELLDEIVLFQETHIMPFAIVNLKSS